MQTINFRFSFCLAGTVLLAAGVIFFPRYLSRSLDMRTLGHVEVSNREDFSFLEQGSNEVFEAADAFRYLGQGEKNPTLLTTVKEPMQINEDLLNEVYIQVMSASEYGMLPWIGPDQNFTNVSVYMDSGTVADAIVWKNWTEHVQFAKYYSLAYESKENSNKRELLNFWYLRFSDKQSFDYSFIVNAVTYQIYYAEIHNANTQEIVEFSEEMLELYDWQGVFREELSGFGNEFGSGCMLYYDATGYDYVNQENLYQKLNIAILYFEDGTPLYIEKSIARREEPGMYKGICIGFQDLIRWVRTLPEDE